MLSVSSKLKSERLLVALAACLLFGALAGQAEGQAGRIVGKIDGIRYEGEQPFITGWACQQGVNTSILVHFFADHAANATPKGTFIVAGKADRENEPAVSQACQDREGGKHRFNIALPSQVFDDCQDGKIYAHGIRAVGNVENALIDGSGLVMKPNQRVCGPDSVLQGRVPQVSGNYSSMAAHPRVFDTPSDLEDIAKRINVPNSYSGKRFSLLAQQIAHDLTSPNKWDTAYSGCKVKTYLSSFSYEHREDHLPPAEVAGILSDMKLDSQSVAPTGAAVVASRLALYAALVKAGAVPPTNGPNPSQATALAKRILLTWSERGFRDDHGNRLTAPTQICDEPWNTGLHVGRGVIYSVQAQDLLMYLGALNPSEAAEANEFHSSVYELLRNSLNQTLTEHPVELCRKFDNRAANIFAGLFATARLTDNRKEVEAVLRGSSDPSDRVDMSWADYFNGVLYGEGDTPMPCGANSGPASCTSRPAFQTPTVEPGEIVDRDRNDGPGQGMGYPMFTLERLLDTAEILRNSGFDPYGYRGIRKQSIELPLQYYECFAKGAGFYGTVTPENSGSCPNAAQYSCKVVNGVDRMLPIGALRYPKNPAITELEAAAKEKSSTGGFSTDAILFGKWRD